MYLKKLDFICLTHMNRLVLIFRCWLLKKTLVITTNLNNPESVSVCVYKDYEVKIKMVQEQWRQLKVEFLMGYEKWKLLFSWGDEPLWEGCLVEGWANFWLVAGLSPIPPVGKTLCVVARFLAVSISLTTEKLYCSESRKSLSPQLFFEVSYHT